LKKRLVPLILASELLLIFTLSGCVLERFDVALLRYFKPVGFEIKSYEIILGAKNFAGTNFQVEKSVKALYVSKDGKKVELESAEFKNSFEMHDFWHKWVKEHFSLKDTLKSELWWFSGRIESDRIVAWYEGKVVFILSGDDSILLTKVKEELDTFVKTFSGVRS